MGGREFLDYIYDEITHKILSYMRYMVTDAIINGAAVSDGSTTQIKVPSITSGVSLSVVAQAASMLSDDAENLCVVMNRKAHAQFIEAMATNGYMFDPFVGYNVIYSNNLSEETSDEELAWLIVGDLSAVQANFPNGDDVKLKYDDLTEAQADLVKIVGRLPVAVGVTVPGRLCVVFGGNDPA